MGDAPPSQLLVSSQPATGHGVPIATTTDGLDANAKRTPGDTQGGDTADTQAGSQTELACKQTAKDSLSSGLRHQDGTPDGILLDILRAQC